MLGIGVTPKSVMVTDTEIFREQSYRECNSKDKVFKTFCSTTIRYGVRGHTLSRWSCSGGYVHGTLDCRGGGVQIELLDWSVVLRCVRTPPWCSAW